MKRIAWLFVAAMCTVALAHAQSSGKMTEMHGTICRSACVTDVGNTPTCDKTCTDDSSTLVFVSDKGHVDQIAESSQNMCMSHVGKHVTMMAAPIIPTEAGREEALRIKEIRNDSGGG